MKDGPWTRVVWKALESSDFVFWLGLFLPRLTIRSSVYGSVFISFGASFCLCILLFYLFVVWLIVRANAVDCPDKRQQHSEWLITQMSACTERPSWVWQMTVVEDKSACTAFWEKSSYKHVSSETVYRIVPLSMCRYAALSLRDYSTNCTRHVCLSVQTCYWGEGRVSERGLLPQLLIFIRWYDDELLYVLTKSHSPPSDWAQPPPDCEHKSTFNRCRRPHTDMPTTAN